MERNKDGGEGKRDASGPLGSPHLNYHVIAGVGVGTDLAKSELSFSL